VTEQSLRLSRDTWETSLSRQLIGKQTHNKEKRTEN